MESLYDKYGGFETVSKVVHGFYDKISTSDSLKPYFEGMNTQLLIDHQTKFFCDIMGGPVAFEGRTLAQIHANMNVTEEAFAEVAELLEETFEDFGVEESDIETLMSIVSDVKDQIVQQ